MWFNFMVNVGKYTSPMDPMGMLLLGTASLQKNNQELPHLYLARRLLFGSILSYQQGLDIENSAAAGVFPSPSDPWGWYIYLHD